MLCDVYVVWVYVVVEGVGGRVQVIVFGGEVDCFGGLEVQFVLCFDGKVVLCGVFVDGVSLQNFCYECVDVVFECFEERIEFGCGCFWFVFVQKCVVERWIVESLSDFVFEVENFLQ